MPLNDSDTLPAPPAQHAPDAATATLEAPVKRKRGRPRKNPDAPQRVVREAPAKPRTAAASATRVTASIGELSPDKLKGLLQALHQVAAIATRAPEFALDDDEAASMAEAIAAVLREYNVPISSKVAALIGLGGTCALVYGPRVVLIKRRQAAERAKRTPLRAVAESAPPAPAIDPEPPAVA